MDISVQPGTYVVAVSGGVDSMALLDVLRQQPSLKLIVAHFDHGIRHDSRTDRQLVQSVAKQHGLPFVYHEGQLGPDASEDVARKARYEFLRAVQEASKAYAIITAHHHDDALETAILNMLRGTGRKGLSSLHTSHQIHRPLLHVHKSALKKYAADQGLVWREDVTNQDTRYARNYVRTVILPQFSDTQRQMLGGIIKSVAETNTELDKQLLHYLHLQPATTILDRRGFILLPHKVAREVLAAWLRTHGIRNFDTKALERLVVAAKVYAPNTTADIMAGHHLQIYKNHLALQRPDR